jgi:hypothetical protein
MRRRPSWPHLFSCWLCSYCFGCGILLLDVPRPTFYHYNHFMPRRPSWPHLFSCWICSYCYEYGILLLDALKNIQHLKKSQIFSAILQNRQCRHTNNHYNHLCVGGRHGPIFSLFALLLLLWVRYIISLVGENDEWVTNRYLQKCRHNNLQKKMLP